MRRIAGVLLCAAGTAFSGNATAQSAAPIELKWNALESCPKADTVLARVHKIAGSSRATPNILRAEATITQPSERRFSLRLEIHYGSLTAVRTIDGKSCKDLAGAAAVALALLLSSEEPLNEGDLAGTSATTGSTAGSNQAGDDPVSAPKPAPPAPPIPPPPPSPEPDSAAGPPRRWNLLLVAPLAALSFGPMPQLSRGIGLAAGFSYDGWRFLAEGKSWASQRETISNLGEEYGIEFGRYTVGARGCRSVFGARFEVAPCMLMSLHHVSVRGSGRNLVSGSDAATWAAVGIGVQARVLITPWLGLVASVDGELQLSRPEVSMMLPAQGSEFTAVIGVRRLEPVAATLAIGPQWIF